MHRNKDNVKSGHIDVAEKQKLSQKKNDRRKQQLVTPARYLLFTRIKGDNATEQVCFCLFAEIPAQKRLMMIVFQSVAQCSRLRCQLYALSS